jgi:hypothetical protein
MDPRALYFVLTLPDAFASIQMQLQSFSATIPHASSQGPQSIAATTVHTRKQADHAYSNFLHQLTSLENPDIFIL